MKALRIILIIAGVLVAAILIIPIFAPATTEVKAGTRIALKPEQVFPFIASFENREVWDPWVAMDSTTKVTIESRPEYVGSTYAWDGDRLGKGKMEVLEIRENEYIRSSLWFGDVETPSTVEWTFELVDGETQVVWLFTEETSYPFQRLQMMIGQVFLKQSFESGLANLRKFLESKPQQLSTLGEITVTELQPMTALVGKGSGTMETISEELGRIYGMVMSQLGSQGLQMGGPPFAHYLDFDMESGHSNFLAGMSVIGNPKDAGEVKVMKYEKMKVAQALHTGPYGEFDISYARMQEYIEANGLEVTGEVLEFYLTDPGMEPDESRWQTMINFRLK